MSKIRYVLLAFAALVLGACTDLSAVGDFAKLSSDVTASTPVFDNYPANTAEALRVSTPQDRATLTGFQQNAVARAELAQAGMKTLSLYMATLAALSDGKLVDFSTQAKSIEGSLQKLSLIKPELADPATALIKLILKVPLDAYRRHAVSTLVHDSNKSVVALSFALADFADHVATISEGAARDAGQFYTTLAQQTSDRSVREMAVEWRTYHRLNYAKTQAQAKAADKILRKIADAHNELDKNIDKLSTAQLKALLSDYGQDIFAAAKFLPINP